MVVFGGGANTKKIAAAEARSRNNAALESSIAIRKSTGAITATSLGLGNVDNTSDAAKPVSTATQTALNGKAAIPAIQTIATDAAATVTPTAAQTSLIVFHTGTLTAGRTITLATASVTTGTVIRFTRTGSGAFNLSIGGLKNLTVNTWADVIYNGVAWQMTAYGAL